MAAMMGAEEYDGNMPLVAMGCIMVRQCHSNTCPVEFAVKMKGCVKNLLARQRKL